MKVRRKIAHEVLGGLGVACVSPNTRRMFVLHLSRLVPMFSSPVSTS